MVVDFRLQFVSPVVINRNPDALSDSNSYGISVTLDQVTAAFLESMEESGSGTRALFGNLIVDKRRFVLKPGN